MTTSSGASRSAMLLTGSPMGDPVTARAMTTSPPPANPPDPEVPPRAQRRSFSAAEKLRILDEADRCAQPGEIAALLRREGIYSSHLAAWRKLRRRGALQGLSPKARGPQPAAKNPLAGKVKDLERARRRLERRLRRAELIIEIQKKASEILRIPLKRPERDGHG